MANSAFDTWLTEKLKSLCVDEDVYVDYLKSVLDEGEGQDLQDSLCDILSGVLENDVNETACEIVGAWERRKEHDDVAVNGLRTEDKDDKIKTLIEKQQTKVISGKKKSQVDVDLKNKLLAQYGEVSDQEDGYGSDEDSAPSQFTNVNAKAVTDKIQQEREKSKKEFEEKKQRDKMNREKEKLKRDERHEKEKKRTQKGERRR